MENYIMTYPDTTGASTGTGTGAIGVTGGAGSIEPGGKVKFNLFLDMLSTKYRAGRVVVSTSKSVLKLLTHTVTTHRFTSTSF